MPSGVTNRGTFWFYNQRKPAYTGSGWLAQRSHVSKSMNANEIMTVNNTGKNIDFALPTIIACVMAGENLPESIEDIFSIQLLIKEGDRPYRIIIDWA